ncbi:hypothetical protein AA103193_1127 [Tanticharoenia sakaeratensis NBRC 103193]|nr:hypothetical protein AA103193_1127 [Tanticharoenia sakaeratensis NBRC 103193]
MFEGMGGAGEAVRSVRRSDEVVDFRADDRRQMVRDDDDTQPVIQRGTQGGLLRHRDAGRAEGKKDGECGFCRASATGVGGGRAQLLG